MTEKQKQKIYGIVATLPEEFQKIVNNPDLFGIYLNNGGNGSYFVNLLSTYLMNNIDEVKECVKHFVEVRGVFNSCFDSIAKWRVLIKVAEKFKNESNEKFIVTDKDGDIVVYQYDKLEESTF